MQNISSLDLLYAHLSRTMKIAHAISLYRSRFSNFFYVLSMLAKKQFPICARLKNGMEILITNYGELVSVLFGFDYDKNADTILLDNGFKLCSATQNGDIIGIFYYNDYDFLPVDGESVIDIGANIADSSLYFVLKGAKKVIALEPYPKNYETAIRNITLNNLHDRISLSLAGCGNTNYDIVIDDKRFGNLVEATASDSGEVVKIRTLQSILEENRLSSAVLKMDCEGCEYDIILNASDITLRHFPSIQIEYHYGYQNLKDKLERVGFQVKNTRPRFSYNPYANRPHTYVGFLYARLL